MLRPKAVNFSDLPIRPLVNGMASCTCCRKRQARWEMALGAEEAQVILCSLCVLYETEQGQRESGKILKLAEFVNLTTRLYDLVDGRLTKEVQADNLVSALVTPFRIASLRNERA